MSDIMLLVFRVPEGTQPPNSVWEAVSLMRAEKSPQSVLITRDGINDLAQAAIGKYVLKAVQRLDESDDVTLPPEALPRSVGGEVIVACPVCKTEWKFDDHDSCPTCKLAPQGVN